MCSAPRVQQQNLHQFAAMLPNQAETLPWPTQSGDATAVKLATMGHSPANLWEGSGGSGEALARESLRLSLLRWRCSPGGWCPRPAQPHHTTRAEAMATCIASMAFQPLVRDGSTASSMAFQGFHSLKQRAENRSVQ